MRIRATVILLALLGTACSRDVAASPRLSTTAVVLRQGAATLRLIVEVADSEPERELGLMGRRSLASDAGMLFVFPSPVLVSFYMKDTLIPLDIAFVDRGRVAEIRSMVPCHTHKCPLTTPVSQFDQAIEVNPRTFSNAGIAAGATVEVVGPLPSPTS